MQDMASGRTAEDAVFVLQADHVDIVKVQKISRVLVGPHVVLGQRPSHARRVVIPFLGVVYRKGQQPSGAVLRGNRAAQVGGERGDSAMSRKIVSDHRDSAG